MFAIFNSPFEPKSLCSNAVAPAWARLYPKGDFWLLDISLGYRGICPTMGELGPMPVTSLATSSSLSLQTDQAWIRGLDSAHADNAKHVPSQYAHPCTFSSVCHLPRLYWIYLAGLCHSTGTNAPGSCTGCLWQHAPMECSFCQKRPSTGLGRYFAVMLFQRSYPQNRSQWAAYKRCFCTI